MLLENSQLMDISYLFTYNLFSYLLQFSTELVQTWYTYQVVGQKKT